MDNLPSPATALIGREHELAAVCALLLRPDVRLPTLTGTPGIGKTRLGFAVAAALRGDFTDSVVFVALASVRDPSLVAITIAQPLGVKDIGHTPLVESLKTYLGDKRLLLVLDNFEQVADAAPLLTDLLAGCPHLKVLITSRAALHLYGEHEFTVPPLALPDLQRLPSIEALSRYAAVDLFVQRAHAARHDFALTSENAPAFEDVGQYLEALPYLQEAESLAIQIQAIDQCVYAVRRQSRCWFRLDRWDAVLEAEQKWRALEQRYTREQSDVHCMSWAS